MRPNAIERILAELGIVVVVACAIAVLGVLQPPGTPLGTRLALAVAGFVAGWAIVRLFAVVGAATARLLGLGVVWGYVFAIPLSSAAISWAVLWYAGGAEAALGEDFAQVWPQTILIGLAFFALFFVVYWRAYSNDLPDEPTLRDASEHEETSEQRAGVSDSALHERLPPQFPPILALSVEDHYVRVIAQEQSEMLLMPLTEAIELMPKDAGTQVHRSWWAARSAVKGHRREGRDLKLELVNGTHVPVSRTMVKPLRESGWFV